MIKSSFSRNLKELRERRNLTKADMARKIGIPYTTYNGYEEGLREPRFETVEKIAKIFNMHPYEMMLTRTEYMTEETAEYLITLCGFNFIPVNDNEYIIQEIENNEVTKSVVINEKALDDFILDISDYITFMLKKMLK